MRKVKEPLPEAPCKVRRTHFTSLTKNCLLVKSVRNRDFCIKVLEIEVKVLNLELDIAEKFPDQYYALPGDSSGSEESSDEEEYASLIKSLRPKVKNDLPGLEAGDSDFEMKEFNVAIMNPGGLRSKKESITNAIHKHNIRAVVVCETHTVGKSVPQLDNTMKAFFHNRSDKANKGGVAIFLEKTLAEHAVVVGKSVGDHEWLALRVNYFSPPVTIVALYGCQASKNSVSAMKRMWDELWSNIDSYSKSSTVLLCGDYNAAVGNRFGLTNNCNSSNKSGEMLAKGLKKHRLKILNGLYDGDHRTHVDRSKDSSRCLDYIATNNPASCTRLVIDNDYEITPYKVTKVREGEPKGERKFTDHKTILASFNLQKQDGKVCNKPPPVVVKDEAGHVKFYEYTDALADTAVELLNGGKKILEVYKIVMRKLKECERLSYLKITKSKIKRKLWSDNEIFLKLTCELEKQASKVENMKQSDKVFKMRGDKILADRNQELFAMFDDKGELVEDKEAILGVLTKYNDDLLSRVPHPDHVRELYAAKKKIVDQLDKTIISEFNTITPREYVRAVQRVMDKGKAMFRQFLRMSPKLLAVLYFVLKKMYEEEVIPDDFIETFLVALHKKGDPRLAANYRFLHMRGDVSRFFQLLIYLKLEAHFDKCTHESQMGAKKMCDTVEHIALVNSCLKAREEKGGGMVYSACDMVKCFDRSFLSDNHAILQLEGGDRKALKVLHKYQKKNLIRVAGSQQQITIEGGMGQGGIPDARITTSGITEATVRHMSKIPREKVFTHNGEQVPEIGYIDDTLILGDDPELTGIATKLYGDTLDELAMSAHPVKSVQVVCGNKEWREQTKKKLLDNPNTLQGFPLKTSREERYLGFLLTESSYTEMLDSNIQDKAGKMMAAAVQIRTLTNLPIIRRFGKSYAQKLMAIAQLAPIGQYGTPGWIDIQEHQYKALEMAFKKALVTVFSVPITVNYEQLLRICGMTDMESFIDCVKLKTWNFKLNCKKSGLAYKTILYEVTRAIPGGLAEDLVKLSDKYGIPRITEGYVCPEVITRECRQAA